MHAYSKLSGVPFQIYRVKKEFVFDGILYAVGVMRLMTGAERVEFIQKLRQLFLTLGTLSPTQEDLRREYEAAESYFIEHFEEVELR